MTVPLALITAVPWVGWVILSSTSGLPAGSEALARTFKVTGRSLLVLPLAGLATGGGLEPLYSWTKSISGRVPALCLTCNLAPTTR